MQGNKVFGLAIVGLMVVALFASAVFADEEGGDSGSDSGSGDGESDGSTTDSSHRGNGNSPLSHCTGNVKRDTVGVSEYFMNWIAKVTGKTRDPVSRTILRADSNVRNFASSDKWKACS